MPRLSGYQLLRLASFLLFSGIRKAALLERRVLAFCRQTPTRRQLSRAFSVVLFGCMSLVLMADEGCGGCKTRPDIKDHTPEGAGLAIVTNWFLGLVGGHPQSIPALHPNATTSSAAPANTASFFGNFTAVTQPSSSYFAILRMKDCSLSLLTASSSLSGAASITSATPNYDRTLHQLASLKTTAGTFANGCAETSAGISSRPAVFAVSPRGSRRDGDRAGKRKQ
jgi:hypothetical protein